MNIGYSQSPRLLKGAIIQFSAPMLVPIPNIIVFQYNPETLTRTLSPWEPVTRTYEEKGERQPLDQHQVRALAQPFDPAETFSVTLELDAADLLEEPATHPVAVRVGVADRLAALEMLLYPPGESVTGGRLNVSTSLSLAEPDLGFAASAKAAQEQLDRKEVPVVLFFWGKGRIVPVRITTFSVEEQAFSPTLFPIRAKVTLGMRVLDQDDLVNVAGVTNPSSVVDIAKACYEFTRAQKATLASANVANARETMLGPLLPF